jgi:RNA polymerase sigma-70 factor (ECF subfamily)
MSDGMREGMIALIPKMRAYAMVLTRSPADADDLVQDTLLRAWRFREGFATGTNLKAWLFRILRNEFLTKAQAGRFITESIDGKAGAQLVSDPDQEINVEYRELLEGLQTLSAETREALLLTVGVGLTYEEAAEVSHCPVGTIKSRVNRARELLARHVEPTPAPATAKTYPTLPRTVIAAAF